MGGAPFSHCLWLIPSCPETFCQLAVPPQVAKYQAMNHTALLIQGLWQGPPSPRPTRHRMGGKLPWPPPRPPWPTAAPT